MALADAEGLDAVSMPRLAREVGSAPMSLYRHVPHKTALVDLMLDLAIGPPPDLGGLRVREALETWARANRAVFARHPWTLPLVSGQRRMGPAECLWAEAVLQVLVDDGRDLLGAVDVLHLLNSYVRGASTPTENRLPTEAELTSSGRTGEMPLFSALVVGQPDPDPEGSGARLFESGLSRVLDAVEG